MRSEDGPALIPVIFKSRIFRKQIAAAFLIWAGALGGLSLYWMHASARALRENIGDRLRLETNLLVGELTSGPNEPLETWAKRAGARADAHVTVIAPNGAVLADSQLDPSRVENQATQPEVQAAFAGRATAIERQSGMSGADFYFFAAPTRYRGLPGYVLRLAIPRRVLAETATPGHRSIWLAALLTGIAALFVWGLLQARLAVRIERLKDFSASLTDPLVSIQALREPQSEDELALLSVSLNRASSQMHNLVERFSAESSRSEAILSSMVEGVLAVDMELRVTFSNASFLRAVGASGPVPDRLPLLQLVREPALVELLTHVLVNGESARERIELFSPEGRSFEVEAAPLVTRSQRGAIAILHDVTELERLERVRRDFVANVSHELRTPLTAIQGYAETLLDGALEDEENNRKFLKTIKAHAIRLNNISSDLLTLSELESKQPAIRTETVSVREALAAAVRAVEPTAALHHVQITSEGDDFNVLADRIRLEQALINLLDNGVKFNHAGGTVRAETKLSGEDDVQIGVSDDGIGIPSQDLPRIFERFYRVDKARSREAGGTGLGLAIVKHIVERMNGRVEVQSQLGKGSTFTIHLRHAS